MYTEHFAKLSVHQDKWTKYNLCFNWTMLYPQKLKITSTKNFQSQIEIIYRDS